MSIIFPNIFFNAKVFFLIFNYFFQGFFIKTTLLKYIITLKYIIYFIKMFIINLNVKVQIIESNLF